MPEVFEQGALDLVKCKGRHNWFVQALIEGGQQEVAGHDRYEDVGVEGGDADRCHP